MTTQGLDRTAGPVRTATLPWMPLGPGVAVRLLRLAGEERTLQLRVEPGTVVARHRHTGDVHAYQLEGCRELGSGATVQPGDYVYEPAGNVDTWKAVGDVPCVVQITLSGRVEVLGDDDAVVSFTDTASLRARYAAWCAETGRAPVALGVDTGAAAR